MYYCYQITWHYWWVPFGKKEMPRAKNAKQSIELTWAVECFAFGETIKFIFYIAIFRYEIPVCRFSTFSFFVCCFPFSIFPYILDELMLMLMHLLCLKEICEHSLRVICRAKLWNKFNLKRKAKLSKRKYVLPHEHDMLQLYSSPIFQSK